MANDTIKTPYRSRIGEKHKLTIGEVIDLLNIKGKEKL